MGQVDLLRKGNDMGESITVVWSAYGHTFMASDSSETCLTCGATYELSPDDPTDPSHGRYHAANGDDPMQCTRDTSMSHGYPNERVCDSCDDGTCEHCSHDCNCLFCA